MKTIMKYWLDVADKMSGHRLPKALLNTVTKWLCTFQLSSIFN